MQPDLYVCGINHKTSSIAIRERVAIAPEQQTAFLQAFLRGTGATECLVLMTCNRCEWYWSGASFEQVYSWLQQYYGLTPAEWFPASYQHQGDIALKHAMQVASGL